MVHQPRILVAVALLQSVILTDLTKQRFHRLGYKPILKGLPEHLHIHPHVRAAFVADLLHLHDIQMFRIARKSKRKEPAKLLPALCGVRHVRIIQVSHDLF